MAARNGQVAMLPVETIVLDTSNPRVARYIEMYGGDVTDEQMSLALGAANYEQGESTTTFQSLRASIRTHGGLIHPILVNRENENRLVVIEGNTRALIYRQFRSDDDSGRWDQIPAIVYDQLDEKEIDAIRLQAHLVGPRPWDPYSKAKYLDWLSNSEHLTTDQIIDFCGGQKTDVHRFIGAYNDMEDHYRPLLRTDDQFDPTRFSAFVEMQAPAGTGSSRNVGLHQDRFRRVGQRPDSLPARPCQKASGHPCQSAGAERISDCWSARGREGPGQPVHARGPGGRYAGSARRCTVGPHSQDGLYGLPSPSRRPEHSGEFSSNGGQGPVG